MIHGTERIRKLLRLALGTVLAVGLCLPLVSQAALSVKTAKAVSTKQAQKGKKPAALKQASASTRSKKKAVQSAKSSSRKVAVAQAASGKSRKLASAKRGAVRGVERVARATKKSSTRMVVSSRKTPVARSVVRVSEPPRLSAGERLGLRASHDPLDLSASVALVVDQETSEVLFSKNDTAVLPIASLTKLMTGLVIADTNLPLDEQITITEDDASVYRHSRLAVGTTLSRGEMMHLALMSSENRAANALGRTFPGGQEQFVRLMNAKAQELGMRDTRYVEPTGLSSQNQSSARDLATLVSVAYERPILRSLSTSPSHQLDLGRRTLQYNNSNRLIRNPEWEIGLQKTGYISEAGRCLVMQAKVAGRQLIMVFLDSAGKISRAQDAERVRRWVEDQSIQRYFSRPQG